VGGVPAKPAAPSATALAAAVRDAAALAERADVGTRRDQRLLLGAAVASLPEAEVRGTAALTASEAPAQSPIKARAAAGRVRIAATAATAPTLAEAAAVWLMSASAGWETHALSLKCAV